MTKREYFCHVYTFLKKKLQKKIIKYFCPVSFQCLLVSKKEKKKNAARSSSKIPRSRLDLKNKFADMTNDSLLSALNQSTDSLSK